MWSWSAAPPLLAYKVWDLIPDSLRTDISDPYDTWVAPLYTRLAMGGSHSVYILMQINLFTIGKALYNYSRVLGNGNVNEETDTHTLTVFRTSRRLPLWIPPSWKGTSMKISQQQLLQTHLEILAGLFLHGARQSDGPSVQPRGSL